MIAALRGTLEAVVEDTALIAVGGVVFRVAVTRRARERFGPIGSAVALPTHLHLREDLVALYGFSDDAERELFQLLIGISNVGPNTALGLLSSMEPARLVTAIESEDRVLLAAVPRIGPRTASRIILELKGKLGSISHEELQQAPAGDLSAVRDYLIGIGYRPDEVQAALAALSPEHAADVSTAVAESIRFLAERPARRGR
jgi:holliday junction DNA helicase RuvA